MGCCPVDGQWSPWSTWSKCSASCNSGNRKRTRVCDSPKPDCKGLPCPGNDTEVELCNVEPCQPEICEDGKVKNNCSNACGLTCASLRCDHECHEPETCKQGCSCPPGLVENEDKKCVKPNQCVCYDKDRIILPLQTFEKDCDTCQCISGCIKCTPKKNCTTSVCEWSQWSEWSNCTDKCNGISKRYRTYYGENCKKNETQSEAKPCDDCRCLINGKHYEDGSQFINPNNKCEECKCIRGNHKCYTLCAETEETCHKKSNDHYTYHWYHPKPNECCGVCNKTKKPTEKCEVKKLKPDYIKANNCISKEIHPREMCSGGCESHEASYVRIGKRMFGDKECKCCAAEETQAEKIIMYCDGKEEEAEYMRIKKCKCNMCGERISDIQP